MIVKQDWSKARLSLSSKVTKEELCHCNSSFLFNRLNMHTPCYFNALCIDPLRIFAA